jgi:6-pyruvoyltetrahydropterin/6-carboxytetrahydropterin synthase
MSWTLRVRDKFQAAHFLREYRGKCENVHGHSFQVEVAIEVRELDPAGLGIDFTLIKARLAAAPIIPSSTRFRIQPLGGEPRPPPLRGPQGVFPVKEVTVWESEDASAIL